jgi:xanthine dehydrogenase small subunit
MSEQQLSRPIRFFHRGAVVEVSDAAATRTVLDWLREDARCTGTKEGCNEGDCGACTVVIGETAAPGDKTAVRGLNLRTVNSCIQFLPTLDGKALFTVEDVKAMAQHQPAQNTHAIKLHPVQQAMVECHGSQCGFCTPGFVMSLWSAYEHHQECGSQPTRQQLADELSGNLCRCTGYRPILDAGQRMFDLPPIALDTAPVIEALQSLRSEQSLAYRAPGQADRFYAPTTLAELATLREANPKARVLAGSTDVGLWVNKMFRPLGDIIFVGAVDEMKRIVEPVDKQTGELYIGAGASLESFWSALTKLFPELTDVWLRFASPPIRNAGTIGGNVANGSPIGDSPPVLMSIDAQIELRKGERVRRMPLESFYLDYMKNLMEPGEFVQGIIVPMSATRRQVRAYKISKRFDCDISALCAGLSIELDDGVVASARLVYGGMAAIVKRGALTELSIIGQPWNQETVNAAKAALAEDFKPLSDMRASAAYRLQVAQNLLQRFWLETRAENPLPSTSTSVFSVMPHITAASATA